MLRPQILILVQLRFAQACLVIGLIQLNNKFSFPVLMASEKKQASKFDQRGQISCNCLSDQQDSSRYFLSKNQHKDDDLQAYFFHQKHQQSFGVSLKTDKHKRSLKRPRPNMLLSPQPKRQTNVLRQYYSPETPKFIREKPANKIWQVKEPQLRGTSPRIHFNISPTKEQRPVENRPTLSQISSCHNFQNLSNLIIPAQQNPCFQRPSIQARLLQYSILPQAEKHLFPGFNSNLSTTDFGARRIKPGSRAQMFNNEEIQTSFQLSVSGAVNDSPLKTQRSIRSARSLQSNEIKPIEKKFEEPPTAQSLIKSYLDVDRSQMFRSKMNPKKSGIGQIGKSRIGGKKNQNKASLKRITDVQEIRSMADSSQEQESDGESVVLDRLMDHGSLFQTSVAQTHPSFQSKVGPQSTTAGRSLLRAFDSNHFR